MAEYTRILLRQGPDAEKTNVILRSGEPAYVTDYKRLVVGDGLTSGGITLGSKFLGFVTFDTISTEVFGVEPGYPGDFIFETNSNLLYVLSGSDIILGKKAYQIKTNYVPVNKTPSPDFITITSENNVLSLVPGSIDARYLAGYSIGRGLQVNPSNQVVIEMKDPSPELSFVGGILQLTDGGIVNDKLAPMEANTIKGRLNLGGTPTNITIDELKQALGLVSESGVITLGVPVGTIIDYAGIEPPPNYLPCDGRELPILQFLELYNAIGNAWGTPSLSSFNLPNLNKRVTIGSGDNVIGSSDTINSEVGSYGGTEANQIQLKNLPKHTHGIDFTIPAHSHKYTVALPQFPGVYETGNSITKSYNNYITIIGGNGPDAAPYTTPAGPVDSLTPSRAQASQTIKSNKRFLQERTIDYILTNYPTALSGSTSTQSATLTSKCYRDSGYIIDSIAADIMNNANHRSIETGNLYFSGYIVQNLYPGSPVPALPDDQVTPTIAAIKSIGSFINGSNIPQYYSNYTNNGVLSTSIFFNPVQQTAVGGLRNFTNVISNSSFIPTTTPNGVVPEELFNTAGNLILLNKETLQKRVVEYVQYNFPYALSGSPELNASELSAKCFRDSGFIIDSIAADIFNNANHRSVETGVFYFSGAVLARAQNSNTSVPTLPEDQVYATIMAISAIGKFITGLEMPFEESYTTRGVLSAENFYTNSQRVLLSGFNNFTLVISNSSNVSVTTPNGTKVEPISSYDVAGDLISNPINKSNLQQQIVNYVNYHFPYALSATSISGVDALSAKCYRDTGYIVDALAADIYNAANHRSVETGIVYFSGAVLARMQNTGSTVPTLPVEQVQSTIAAITAIGAYITGIDVPSQPPNIIGGPILDAGSGGENRNGDVLSLINVMVYPLSTGKTDLNYVPAGNPTSESIDLGNNILSNKDTIQRTVSSYVDKKNYLTTSPELSAEYTQKCVRDVGFMLDAVANDLITGVNSKSIQYAVAYWDGSTTRLPENILVNQQANTLDVIEYLKSVTLKIAINRSNSVSNLSIKKVNDLVETMVYPLKNNGESKSYNPPGLLPTPDKLTAAQILLNNKENLQNKVTNYVLYKNYLPIDSDLLAKCRRDVGYMIDAIINDLKTGVNAKSVQYALAYWEGSTTRLPEGIIPNQRKNTIDTIEFLISNVLYVLKGFGGIIDFVEDLTDVMVYPLKNNGLLLPYNPPGEPVTTDRELAASILESNRTSLQNQTITFVDSLNIISDRPDLQAKCYRDIGFMVDSVVSDLRSGVTSRSIQYGLAYWDGAVNRIGGTISGVNNNVDQRFATIETIKFLRDRSIDLIVNSGGLNTTLNLLTSSTNLSGDYVVSETTSDGSLYGIENEPVTNIQPSAVVNKCIRVQ